MSDILLRTTARLCHDSWCWVWVAPDRSTVCMAYIYIFSEYAFKIAKKTSFKRKKPKPTENSLSEVDMWRDMRAYHDKHSKWHSIVSQQSDLIDLIRCVRGPNLPIDPQPCNVTALLPVWLIHCPDQCQLNYSIAQTICHSSQVE